MKNIKSFKQFESLIHQNTLDQMRRVAKELDGIDIGKRVSDDSFANALSDTKRDIVQTNIQTYDDFMEEPFEDNQNRKPWEERKNKR